MRVSRKVLEEKLGTKIGKVHVFVASAKPGEPIGAWGEWAHTFDPDDPGGPGEGVGGSDFADYMPDESLNVRAGAVKGPLIEVDLSPLRPPEAAPPPPGPLMELIAGAVIAVIVIAAVVAFLLLRKKKK